MTSTYTGGDQVFKLPVSSGVSDHTLKLCEAAAEVFVIATNATDQISFGDVLVNWAAATLLSDNTEAPQPYRYNSGTWSVSHADGIGFRFGSISLYFVSTFFGGYSLRNPCGQLLSTGERRSGDHGRPFTHTVTSFNARTQPPHSNMYAYLGRYTATVRLSVTAELGNRITVVVKE